MSFVCSMCLGGFHICTYCRALRAHSNTRSEQGQSLRKDGERNRFRVAKKKEKRRDLSAFGLGSLIPHCSVL